MASQIKSAMMNVILASTLTLLPLFGTSVLRAEEQPASFGYLLQADRLAKDKAGAVNVLAECDRDRIILDASYLADDGIRWTKDDLKTIRAGKAGRKVIAYLSIGEAEEYRWYWQDKWKDRLIPLLIGTAIPTAYRVVDCPCPAQSQPRVIAACPYLIVPPTCRKP